VAHIKELVNHDRKRVCSEGYRQKKADCALMYQ
jgi:hypothetical protein